MKKVVFFDIDGTLVTRNNQIPKSTVAAVDQLKQKGNIPVIATGRAPLLLKEIAKELKINSYIAMNGQYIVHEGEVVYSNPLETNLVDEVIKVAIEKQDGVLLSTANEIIANSLISLANRGTLITLLKGVADWIPERIQLKLWQKMMQGVPEKTAYENKEIYMLNIHADQHEEKEYVEIFGKVLNFTRANEISLDIVNKGTTKATGVEKMMEVLGIPRQRTFAFGDGLNDMEMIRYVGTGVAMENGFDELKAAADVVTSSVFNHGIANGLKRLGLI